MKKIEIGPCFNLYVYTWTGSNCTGLIDTGRDRNKRKWIGKNRIKSSSDWIRHEITIVSNVEYKIKNNYVYLFSVEITTDKLSTLLLKMRALISLNTVFKT